MNLHVIIGEDDYLVAEAAKRIIGDGVGLEVVDSNTATNEELQLKDLRAVEESIMTPPFFDPKKTTWWKNVHFLPGGGRGKGEGDSSSRVSEAVKEALLAFAKRLAGAPPPDNQHVILSGPKLLTTSVFAKTLAPCAEMIIFEKPKRAGDVAEEALARVLERAETMGLKFAPGAAERFVARVGGDTRSIVNELGKLRDYLGGEKRAIAGADIDELTSPGVGVEPVMWAVTDAISARDAARALQAVAPFEGENGYAVMMTTLVEKHLRQLVELKAAAEVGQFDAAAANMPPWAARKMQGALRNWTLNELRVSRMRFLALRERCVVSSGGNLDAAVTIELVRALSRGTAARPAQKNSYGK